MAVLSAAIAPSVIHNNSAGLNVAYEIARDNKRPPFGGVLAQASIAGTKSTYSPITEVENNLGKFAISRAFYNDFYDRFHVDPITVELGNVLSERTAEVKVWSAFTTAKTLTSITETPTQDGVAIEGFIGAYEPLQEVTYIVRANTNGPLLVDVDYIFHFDIDITVSVSGRRVILWPYMPQTQHKEVLEWKTDILMSFEKEQRLALRDAPRQSFNFQYQLDPQQFSRSKAIAHQWAHRVYGIPVWSELDYVGNLSQGALEILLDTSYKDYRDNDVLIIWVNDEDYYAAEIVNVLPDRVTLKSPLESDFNGAYVAPLRFARTYSGAKYRRSSNDIIVATMMFDVNQNADLEADIGYTKYRGKDVMLDRTVLVTNINETISRAIDIFDNESAPTNVDIQKGWVDKIRVLTFDSLDRPDRWRMRQWLHSRKGRQKGFWLPTWNNDCVLLEDVGALSSAIIIAPIGHSLYYGVTDIMIQLVNGTQIFKRVLEATVDINGNEVLSLDAQVGQDFTVADVEFICFIEHVRFNSDRIEISHGYGGRAYTAIPVIEVPE